MNKSRCLGLIGGVGVGATTHYYARLAKEMQRRGVVLDIVIAHADMAAVLALVQAGDRDALASHLLGFVHRLLAAGAECVAVPAVTPHFCRRELTAASPLPLLDIFAPLQCELTARSARRVAVFGTRYVMESNLFGFLSGVEIAAWPPEEMAAIHTIYTRLASQGVGTDEDHNRLSTLAMAACARDHLDGIVLAGTDLSLVFNERNTGFPHFDCAVLHLNAIAAAIDPATQPALPA